MAGWSDLLGQGGQIGETLLVWGVLNQIIGDLLAPMEDLIRQKVESAHPEVPNSPADLADMVVRGVLDITDAEAEARLSGVNRERFDRLRLLTGEPIGLESALQAYRRGLIDWADTGQETPSMERAIKTARFYDYWSPVIKGLADIPISPGEAVNAALRGQVDMATARAEAYANGINADRFQILLDSAGRPPSPGELIELLRRGLIPLEGTGPQALTFQQGIYEGDSKDKWWPKLAELRTYIPPPRTVTTLLKSGGATTEQAAGWFADAGMDAATVAAYVKSAQGDKLAGTRHLAEQTVLTLYETRALTATEATAHLTGLGYDTADAELVLEVVDLQRELRVFNSAVTRVGTLYVGHKITRAGASDALAALDLSKDHVDHLLTTWDAEAAVNVRTLTPTQVVDAWEYGVIGGDEAAAELQALGYTARDAWILLSVKAKGPLPNPPPQGPTGPGAIP